MVEHPKFESKKELQVYLLATIYAPLIARYRTTLGFLPQSTDEERRFLGDFTSRNLLPEALARYPQFRNSPLISQFSDLQRLPLFHTVDQVGFFSTGAEGGVYFLHHPLAGKEVFHFFYLKVKLPEGLFATEFACPFKGITIFAAEPEQPTKLVSQISPEVRKSLLGILARIFGFRWQIIFSAEEGVVPGIIRNPEMTPWAWCFVVPNLNPGPNEPPYQYLPPFTRL